MLSLVLLYNILLYYYNFNLVYTFIYTLSLYNIIYQYCLYF